MTRKIALPILMLGMLGYAFLYLPLLTLVVYSFNESSRVTMWTRFSTKWYTALGSSGELLEATGTSVTIAALSATIAVVIGTAAAFALNRFRRFPGRSFLALSSTLPLATPEVLLGFALLLLFVTVGLDRGFLTVTIAHATLGTAYVAVVLQARLQSFDLSLEQAAADLGAKPLQAFALVTLPLLVPAIVSGWLLAFVLSLDDLVLASFVNGPGTSTLPMVIFGRIRTGLSPEVNALAALFIAFVAMILIAVLLLDRSGAAARGNQE